MSKNKKVAVVILLTALWWTTLIPIAFAGGFFVDHTCTDLDRIPDQWIEKAKSDLHVAYQHTSHGSQLITGLSAIESFPEYPAGKYAWHDPNGGSLVVAQLNIDDKGIPDVLYGKADLSQGDYIPDGQTVTPWVIATRDLLGQPYSSSVNVIMWSWCSINIHNAQRYVDNMEILISEYPQVTFVFMTGHAEGQGENLYTDPDAEGDGHVHYNNQLIRAHCKANNRILFDFADIEAYNPDGEYFWHLNLTDNLNYTGGNWAVEWIAANEGHELEKLTTGNDVAGYSGCTTCSHSGSPSQANLNCVLKGRAVWWLMARIAGWQPGMPVAINSLLLGD